MAKFPNYIQHDEMDCGPTCLKIISKYYGKNFSVAKLRDISETTRLGTTLLGLAGGAETIGFKTLGVKISFNQLCNELPLPCILYLPKKHFIVVYKITKQNIFVSDPAIGLIVYTHKEFMDVWLGKIGNVNSDSEIGVGLALEPSPEFFQNDDEENFSSNTFKYLLGYLCPYKKLILQLIAGLIAGSLIQLIIPFLTQSIVDIGIQNLDINFIYLVLIAQLSLFIGSTSIELIRTWILLHISTRVNLSMLSGFFTKLMSLPISYFDAKKTGDIFQKINDHHRIEGLLTTSTLNVLFSVINAFLLNIILITYSPLICIIILVFNLSYIGWTLIFFKKREEIDYKSFSQMSQDQNKVIELINGMQDIKLNNAERQKRWGWEYIQVKKFKLMLQSTTISQIQTIGAHLINQLQNIVISILTAQMVINGSITLGMMLSISYVSGQLNNPIHQLIGFLQTLQDAKISINRINEIKQLNSEESICSEINVIDFEQDILIENLSFRYPGALEDTLENISFRIPKNKTTAIVGSSGSGKTTLIKILLKFYPVLEGHINLGYTNLNDIVQKEWRKNCGVVMQEGFIYNDTIANNITIGDTTTDKKRLIEAIKLANLYEFIEKLPLKYNTVIGNEGIGLSLGEKQRIMIARAVYKNPKVIFFDEATSSLDAVNEKQIVDNLDKFLKNRTSVVIAHRLSTIKNAEQIVVLHNGKIVEIGNHLCLIQNKGAYYNLVKNQIELE